MKIYYITGLPIYYIGDFNWLFLNLIPFKGFHFHIIKFANDVPRRRKEP